jgi:hypothetical protein
MLLTSMQYFSSDARTVNQPIYEWSRQRLYSHILLQRVNLERYFNFMVYKENKQVLVGRPVVVIAVVSAGVLSAGVVSAGVVSAGVVSVIVTAGVVTASVVVAAAIMKSYTNSPFISLLQSKDN